MQLIDNAEDFEGLGLYTYTLSLNDPTKPEIEAVEYHLEDYSWEAGLAIATARVDQQSNVRIYTFTSVKIFEPKAESSWKEEDLESNIYTRLVGKEQFFSNIFADAPSIESREVVFSDGSNDYRVEFSKYSELKRV